MLGGHHGQRSERGPHHAVKLPIFIRVVRKGHGSIDGEIRIEFNTKETRPIILQERIGHPDVGRIQVDGNEPGLFRDAVLSEEVANVATGDEVLMEVHVRVVAVSIDEEVIPVSLLHQMFGVGQTILPTGGIKPKFNAVVVANLNVFTDEINDTVLCSLRKVLNFMRLNV